MDTNFEIYDGKSFKDLVKDIVQNSQVKRDQMDIIISELRDKISTVNDIPIVAPIIKDYMEASIKNDEQLVKLAGVIQRLNSATQSGATDQFSLSEEERNQLLKEIDDVKKETDSPLPSTGSVEIK